MKKILTIILFLISLQGLSQVKQNYPQYGGTWNRLSLKWNGGFQLSRSAVSTRDLNVAAIDTGQIYYSPADSSIQYHTGFQWLSLIPGLTPLDSASMLANYLRGATAGYGMLITGGQHKTWAVDSFSLASRAKLYQVADSLGALISGATPTLQEVTTAGNATTNGIIVNNQNVSSVNSGTGRQAILSNGDFVAQNTGGFQAQLRPDALTGNRIQYFPDYAGIFAVHPTIVGQAGKVLAVNGGETGLDWITGGGTNFANADLTLTADRFHQLDDKTLIIENGIFGQLLIDGLNRRYAFGDHAAEGNGRSLIILDTATVTPAYKMIGVQQETTSNVLYYDETTGKISYDAAPAGGGATVALDNLSSVAINAALVLGTSDAFALGSTTKHWSDLFLAEGGVINWDNGDATLTQVGNTLTYENGETFELKTANTGVTSFQITDAGSAQYRLKIREYGGVIEGYNSTLQLYNSFSNGVLNLGGRNIGNQLVLGGASVVHNTRNSEKQGADVASAAGAIALGTDGNSFEITGTSAITLISNVDWQNGATITLWFTSTASLTDGTANSGTDIGIELAGGLNFTGSAGAGITLQLIEIGGTQRWREKSRSVN